MINRRRTLSFSRSRRFSLTTRQWQLAWLTLVLFVLYILFPSRDSPRSPFNNLPFSPVKLTAAQRADPFAYVFYATDDQYTCSALVNIEILRAQSRHPIYILVTSAVSPGYIDRLKWLGVQVVVEVPPETNEGVGYYQDVLLKLFAFKMHHYFPHLRRIVTMDADQLVLGNIDNLFLLPAVTLAAPRAYWLGHDAISSTMMVIELSNTTWNRVDWAIKHIEKDKYDMDLVQDLFHEDVLLLPGQYSSINSHWEAWDLPSWFTGYGELEKIGGDDRRTNETDARFVELYRQSQIMHFFAVGKPWSYSPDIVISLRDDAHWLLARQFEEWQEKANQVCLTDMTNMYNAEWYTPDPEPDYDPTEWEAEAQGLDEDGWPESEATEDANSSTEETQLELQQEEENDSGGAAHVNHILPIPRKAKTQDELETE